MTEREWIALAIIAVLVAAMVIELAVTALRRRRRQ